MNLPLIITPEAEGDLAEARGWYRRKREGLAEEFILCIEEALERIRRFPQAATEVYPGVRRVVVRRFPYGVFYRVDPDQIAVIVSTTAGVTPGDCRSGPNGFSGLLHRR